MREFAKRVLPRLMLDTASCIQMTYDDVEHDRRSSARRAVMLLHTADATDVDRSISMLREMAAHLREIERTLRHEHRPFSAQKVRRVRERVEHMVGPTCQALPPGSAAHPGCRGSDASMQEQP